jgi:hypothetical protein
MKADSPKERVRTALEGGKPAGVPIYPIYDMGYIMRCTGQDERAWTTATSRERIDTLDAAFRRHPVDGCFVHVGATDEFAKTHTVEKTRDYWLVTNRETGERYRLLEGGCRAQADGTPIPRAASNDGVCLVQTEADIAAKAPPILAVDDPAMQARCAPLRHFIAKYPDHHFGFQTGTPMIWALNTCGGYVEGLTLMKEDLPLFKKLLEYCTESKLIDIAAGAKAGGHSVWFTSYYTGADTISPRDYAEIVFPYDLKICRAARDAGLKVLNWYLGDLMPNLDTVMKLPLDALVLEQGRKGYTIDPVEIRKRVGPRFCLFGFGYENDFCEDRRQALSDEIRRQYAGAGRDGAFIVGTPIMPPNARPEAVDHYFSEARRLS